MSDKSSEYKRRGIKEWTTFSVKEEFDTVPVSGGKSERVPVGTIGLILEIDDDDDIRVMFRNDGGDSAFVASKDAGKLKVYPPGNYKRYGIRLGRTVTVRTEFTSHDRDRPVLLRSGSKGPITEIDKESGLIEVEFENSGSQALWAADIMEKTSLSPATQLEKDVDLTVAIKALDKAKIQDLLVRGADVNSELVTYDNARAIGEHDLPLYHERTWRLMQALDREATRSTARKNRSDDYWEVVVLLVCHRGVDVNKRGTLGCHSLLWLSILESSNRLMKMRYLLDAKADPNLYDFYGYTALHKMVEAGFKEPPKKSKRALPDDESPDFHEDPETTLGIIRLLLDRKANVNQKTNSSWHLVNPHSSKTPLGLAKSKTDDIAALLRGYGATEE